LSTILIDLVPPGTKHWPQDRPVVLEVKTDPEVPPLPPHITLQQAKKFTETLLKGDQREGNVIAGTARQVFESILPGGDRDDG